MTSYGNPAQIYELKRRQSETELASQQLRLQAEALRAQRHICGAYTEEECLFSSRELCEALHGIPGSYT